MQLILHYIPYVLLYSRALRDLWMGALADHASETGSVQYAQFQRNYKSSKNSAKKTAPMTRAELEPVVKNLTAKQPFQSRRLAVTNPGEFLNSILPYMLKQKMITEERKNGKILYRYRK